MPQIQGHRIAMSKKIQLEDLLGKILQQVSDLLLNIIKRDTPCPESHLRIIGLAARSGMVPTNLIVKQSYKKEMFISEIQVRDKQTLNGFEVATKSF